MSLRDRSRSRRTGDRGMSRRTSLRKRVGAAVGCALILACVHTSAEAQNKLSVQLSSEVSYGEVVALHITLQNSSGQIDWKKPIVPPVAGLRFGTLQGPNRGSSIQFQNGRRSATYTFSYSMGVQAERGRTGTFEIGPIRVEENGGRVHQSPKLKLAVYKQPVLGVVISVVASPSRGRVGAPTGIVYSVQFPKTQQQRRRGGFPSFFGSDDGGPRLRKLYFPILENTDLKCTSVAADNKKRESTVRLGDVELIYQQGFEVKENQTAYSTLTFAFDVIPRKIGKYDIGNARATVLLPTGRYRSDGFGGGRIAERRDYSGAWKGLTYEVYALPSAGQPAGFTGAVGRFEIEVSTKDTKVNAFDPIALEVRVRGTGLLEDLAAPDWSRVAAITKDFKVSADVHSGDLQGESKVFQQVIRATNADVKEIPALPFPYYDPWTRSYAIVHSKPIPIEVAAVHTVGASEAIGHKNPVVDSGKPGETSMPAVKKNDGIPPNARELGDVASSLASGREFIGPAFLASAFAPPILFLGYLFVRRSRTKDPAIRARQRALTSAKEAIASSGTDLEGISESYQNYFRQRFGLPDGELTSPQLRETLVRHDAAIDVVERAVDCLETLLASRFGAGSGSADAIAARSAEILTEIDALKV